MSSVTERTNTIQDQATNPLPANSPEPEAQDDASPAGPEIDLNVLAQKVYALLKRDARLERERRAGPGGW